MDAGLEHDDLARHKVLVVDVAALRLNRAVDHGGHNLLALPARIADDGALRAALPGPEREPLRGEALHVQDGDVALGIEEHDRRAQGRAVRFLARVRCRPRYDMRTGHDITVADGKAAACDDAPASPARPLDHPHCRASDSWRGK